MKKQERDVIKTQDRMKRKRNIIRYGLNHSKMLVGIGKEDDETKAAFLESLKTAKITPSRSYLISKGMWSELERLDASLHA